MAGAYGADIKEGGGIPPEFASLSVLVAGAAISGLTVLSTPSRIKSRL